MKNFWNWIVMAFGSLILFAACGQFQPYQIHPGSLPGVWEGALLLEEDSDVVFRLMERERTLTNYPNFNHRAIAHFDRCVLVNKDGSPITILDIPEGARITVTGTIVSDFLTNKDNDGKLYPSLGTIVVCRVAKIEVVE